MAGKQATSSFMANFRRWAYNKSGFNQYGLKIHDCFYETPEVAEAIRRLPSHVIDERNYRITRALHLSMTKTVLPKDEWMTYEQDDYYLDPYLSEVKREFQEKEEWAKK